MTGRPSLTKRRLDELDAISRERELTDAEQRECRWLGQQERWAAEKRRRYAEDQDFRRQHIERVLRYDRAQREARD
jgi:hypothetical protein